MHRFKTEYPQRVLLQVCMAELLSFVMGLSGVQGACLPTIYYYLYYHSTLRPNYMLGPPSARCSAA